MSEGPAQAEASGETVGEAKWLALRELESRYPGLDRERVSFEVLSEGERGLLGVGTSPARVVARLETLPEAAPIPAPGPEGESARASLVRELLAEVASALGARCRIDVDERDDELSATLSGPDVAVLIGKRGKTIDSIQYVVAAAVSTAEGHEAAKVTVDAGGYRSRRQARLIELAEQAAARCRRSGRRVELEPMTSVERKIVHLHLKSVPDVETHSEGDEPYRFVVLSPARELSERPDGG